MPSLEVPEAGQLRLIWSLAGTDYAVNVLAFRLPAATQVTQTLANTVGAAVKARMTSSGQAGQVNSTVALSRVGLRDVRTANLPEFTDVGAAVPGTGTGSVLPLQTALCITLRTALAGPRFRGRVYLCGYGGSANFGSGTFTTAARDAAVSFVTGIQSDLTAQGLTLAVLSRPKYSADIPPVIIRAGALNNVVAILARDLVWDTQRRRALPGI